MAVRDPLAVARWGELMSLHRIIDAPFLKYRIPFALDAKPDRVDVCFGR